FIQTEEQFKEALDRMFFQVNNEKTSNDKVILMVHNPPIDCKLDFALTVHEHIGSKSVREAIEKYNPDLCVCGHVHESSGIETIGKTICVNPGATRFGNASIIEIKEKIKDEISVAIIKIEVS
ncbi:MAG: metallophosphoesterase, partial [archaeon]|nr:metallophosphoesterase [archaeon]